MDIQQPNYILKQGIKPEIVKIYNSPSYLEWLPRRYLFSKKGDIIVIIAAIITIISLLLRVF